MLPFHPLFSRLRFAPLRGLLALSFSFTLFSLPAIAGGPGDPGLPGEVSGAHIFTNRSGVLQTRDGLTLKVKTDLGTVRVVRLEEGAPALLRYSVRIETDAKNPLAQKLLDHYTLKASATSSGVELLGSLPPEIARGKINAQFYVQFEITVPSGFSVDINTEAGDIETQDIGGAASLITQGGNIRTGHIGVSKIHAFTTIHPLAKLQTEGGHIQVLDVAGDLNAFTAGGHINVGNVWGDATLRTGGGHIRAEQISGRAELDTDGGNITIGHAQNFVNVRTAGGQIDFGEVRGSVRAQTGGGGIRILYVTGPMEVESSGGSICLTHVAGAIQAATGVGAITAWISPEATSSNHMVQLAGASQLTSGNGDIIVFLPRNLAANIEAVVASGGERRIEADPALNLSVQSAVNNGNPWARGIVALNGGGAPLKLKTTTGKIRLEFLDSQTALRESLIREQQDRINGRMKEVSNSFPAPNSIPAPDPPPQVQPQGDWLERLMDNFEIAVTGGLRENPTDFQKRLLYSPPPPYPDLAKRAGIQGPVLLQVRVTKDGRVEVLKLVEGEPVLADSAIATVKLWRAKPVWSNGKPLEVISTVKFNFQLQ